MEVIGLMEVVCCAFELFAEKESRWYVNKILSEHSYGICFNLLSACFNRRPSPTEDPIYYMFKDAKCL